MTESDYIELIILAKSSAGTNANNFIAVMFAYIVASYFVGESLSRIQAWGISIIYSLFTLLPIYGVYLDIGLNYSLQQEFHATFPDEAIKLYSGTSGSGVMIFFVPALLAAAWLASILHMAYIRRGNLND